MTEKAKTRHVLSLSGGKDSTALAIHMKGKVPEMEYVFCDTGEELKETYEYLDRLEDYLEKRIERLNPDRPFKHYLDVYKGVLPDANTRWCTRMLKIKPFERYVGEDAVTSYVGIRHDERGRRGYISTKPNITARYPFIEDRIGREEVMRLLDKSGLGLPAYYDWRSRSGCYFCFFQQMNEWVGLLEHHPDQYWKAADFEKIDQTTGERFTWNSGESLYEISMPERVLQIKTTRPHRPLVVTKRGKGSRGSLVELLRGEATEDDENQGCLICHL